MEPERKHEQNVGEVREFVDKFKDVWDKYGNKLMTVVIVGLLIYGSMGWYARWQAQKAEDAYGALASAGTADMLLFVAGEHDMVYDEAVRRQADTLYGSALLEMNAGNTVAAEGEIAKAFTAYTALADNGKTTEYQLAGIEGLGKIAEMQSNYEEAQAKYQQMITLAGERFLDHARRAQLAIDRLDLIRNTPEFSPADPPVSLPPSTPQTPEFQAPFDIGAPTTPDSTGDLPSTLPDVLTPATDGPTDAPAGDAPAPE